MAKFTVYVTTEITGTIEVEAENMQQASNRVTEALDSYTNQPEIAWIPATDIDLSEVEILYAQPTEESEEIVEESEEIKESR